MFRIPSPIKARLDEKPRTTQSVETFKRTVKGKKEVRVQQEEKIEKLQEFDTSLISNNPKKITMIDKLQQIS